MSKCRALAIARERPSETARGSRRSRRNTGFAGHESLLGIAATQPRGLAPRYELRPFRREKINREPWTRSRVEHRLSIARCRQRTLPLAARVFGRANGVDRSALDRAWLCARGRSHGRERGGVTPRAATTARAIARDESSRSRQSRAGAITRSSNRSRRIGRRWCESLRSPEASTRASGPPRADVVRELACSFRENGSHRRQRRARVLPIVAVECAL